MTSIHTQFKQMAIALGFRKVCAVGTDNVTLKQLTGLAKIKSNAIKMLHDRLDDLKPHFDVRAFQYWRHW